MSRLEVEVRDELLALASGDRVLRDLDREQGAGIARWATKTAIAARSADLGPKVVGPDQGRTLAAGEMPPVWVVARQSVPMGLSWYSTQRWAVTYVADRRAEVTELIGRSYKTVLTVGALVLCVCYWPDPRWPLLISDISHRMLWSPTNDWLTYPYATDRHGATPSRETETIDMVVGTRVVHPSCRQSFTVRSAS
jgi:hypothetical protein